MICPSVEKHHDRSLRFDSMRPAATALCFTLIELLVVVAIIAILAAMLLPVLGRARETARVAACMNNQKQMAVCLAMYADDYGDFPPYNFTGYPDTHLLHSRRNEFDGTAMYEWMLPMLRDEGYAGDVRVGYCSKAGEPYKTQAEADADPRAQAIPGCTPMGSWPSGLKWRMDHDYKRWQGGGDFYATYLTNQGDFAYYGPGTSHYDWEHWSNKTVNRLWIFMLNAVPSMAPSIGHVGGIHSDGRLRKGHCGNSERDTTYPFEGPDVEYTVDRMPLMMDSFLTGPGGSRYPHFPNSASAGKANVMFHDGSIETWDYY